MGEQWQRKEKIQKTVKCTHLKVKAGEGSVSGRGTAGTHCCAPTSLAAGDVLRNYRLHSVAATHAQQFHFEVRFHLLDSLVTKALDKVPTGVTLPTSAVVENPLGVQANCPTSLIKKLARNAVEPEQLKRGVGVGCEGRRAEKATRGVTFTYRHCCFCNLIANSILEHPPKVLHKIVEVLGDIVHDLKKGQEDDHSYHKGKKG
jgi:hypothetical protein